MPAVLYETEVGWVVKTDNKITTFVSKEKALESVSEDGIEVDDLSLVDNGTKKKRKKRDKK